MASSRRVATARFRNWEELRTEISAKFTPERLDGELAAAGLRPGARYTDGERLYALSLVRRA